MDGAVELSGPPARAKECPQGQMQAVWNKRYHACWNDNDLDDEDDEKEYFVGCVRLVCMHESSS